LTDKKAIYVEALTNFTDSRGNDRRAGDVWIVTKDDCEVYISDVGSKIINNNVEITTLNNRQYCIIGNPVENGKPQYGKRRLIKQEGSFFLKPNEILEGKIECNVLTAEKALSVRANTTFLDKETNKKRLAGENWLEYGPKEYWPPLEVTVDRTRDAFFKLEGLNIYWFRYDILFMYLFAVLIGLFYLLRFVRGLFS